MKPRSNSPKTLQTEGLRMYLVPCSCGATFYDRHGARWSRYLICPGCRKRHDPKNRLLELGYDSTGYWKVDKC